VERLIVRPVRLQNRVKRALITMMPHLDARKVKRDRPGLASNAQDVLRRDVHDLCFGIAEAEYQPGAGDTIYADVLSGYPLHRWHTFFYLFGRWRTVTGAIFKCTRCWSGWTTLPRRILVRNPGEWKLLIT